jgi:hypothetical protein
MKDREIILGVLHGIGRRLWVGRALQEAFFGLCVLLFFLIAFRMAGAVQPSGIPAAGMPAWLSVGAAIAASVAYLAWRISQRVTLAQAAAQADTRATLRDELKSAYWFVSHAEQSPFIEVQVARAAATARRLDPRAIVPGRPPRSLWAAAGLGIAFAFVSWLAPQLSPWWESGAAPAAAEMLQQEDLRALLRDAPKDAQIEKLDQALETLQRADATAEQRRRAIEDMRDASEQANMEAAAAREGLARIAEVMKANPKLGEVAEALQAGNNREAMDLLEEIRRDAAAQQETQGEEQFPEAAKATQHQGSLAEQFDQAGRDLSGTPNLNAPALDNLMKALEQATQEMDVQNRVNQIQRRARENMVATTQRSAASANEAGSARQDVANPEPSPDNGNADAQGASTFRRDSANREEDADGTREGSRTGSASGESPSMALEGRATQRLEAQLKLEAIQRRDDKGAGEEQDDKGWIYTASQQQASALDFEQVRARDGFDREAASQHDRIPIRQKQVVKDYFLNLHESEKK